MTEKASDSTHDSTTQAEALIYMFLGSDPSTPRLREQAGPLLSSQDLLQAVAKLNPEDKENLVDKLNQVYLTIDPQNQQLLASFGNFCSGINQLPASASLSTELVKCDDIPVSPGGLMDIWRGRYQGALVAIKAFRIYPPQSLEEAREILWKRVPTWKKLTHPNIAAFHGVTTELFRLALVYDWKENGNILCYMRSHSQESPLALLLQVARGLQYLHSLEILHGSLKGSNVLVDESGRVQLTDYGLAPIHTNPNLTTALPTVGNSRWLAPEIVNPPPGATETVVESKSADVFAFGMLAVEVFTGEPPFAGRNDSIVALLISQGGRPELPRNAKDVGLTGQVWELLQKCWHEDPAQRPTIDEVVRSCEAFLGNDQRVQKNIRRTECGELVPGAGGPLSVLQPTSLLATTGRQPNHPAPRRARRWWRELLCW